MLDAEDRDDMPPVVDLVDDSIGAPTGEPEACQLPLERMSPSPVEVFPPELVSPDDMPFPDLVASPPDLLERRRIRQEIQRLLDRRKVVGAHENGRGSTVLEPDPQPDLIPAANRHDAIGG